MLKSLARKWALFVSDDSRSSIHCLVVSASGLVFILVYVTGVVDSELMLGLGLLVLFTGFHLFERLGLLLLLDEKQRTGSAGNRAQGIGTFE